MTSSVRAVIAGHGQLPAGLVSAVQQITGRGEEFIALSNCDLSSDVLESTLKKTLDDTGVRVIFTDLPGGSCTMAARRIQKVMPDLVLVTGANLATLLDFLGHEHGGSESAAQHATERGRASMSVVRTPRGD